MSEKPVASIKTLARYEPDTVYIGTGEYVAECVRADDGDYYLAADVDAAIEALRAEVDALAKDAARYRWLRDREIPEWLDLWHQNPDRIDAAIDQARGRCEP